MAGLRQKAGDPRLRLRLRGLDQEASQQVAGDLERYCAEARVIVERREVLWQDGDRGDRGLVPCAAEKRRFRRLRPLRNTGHSTAIGGAPSPIGPSAVNVSRKAPQTAEMSSSKRFDTLETWNGMPSASSGTRTAATNSPGRRSAAPR